MAHQTGSDLQKIKQRRYFFRLATCAQTKTLFLKAYKIYEHTDSAISRGLHVYVHKQTMLFHKAQKCSHKPTTRFLMAYKCAHKPTTLFPNNAYQCAHKPTPLTQKLTRLFC